MWYGEAMPCLLLNSAATGGRWPRVCVIAGLDFFYCCRSTLCATLSLRSIANVDSFSISLKSGRLSFFSFLFFFFCLFVFRTQSGNFGRIPTRVPNKLTGSTGTRVPGPISTRKSIIPYPSLKTADCVKLSVICEYPPVCWCFSSRSANLFVPGTLWKCEPKFYQVWPCRFVKVCFVSDGKSFRMGRSITGNGFSNGQWKRKEEWRWKFAVFGSTQIIFLLVACGAGLSITFKKGAPSKLTRKRQPFVQQSLPRAAPSKLTRKWEPFIQQWLQRGKSPKLTWKWQQIFNSHFWGGYHPNWHENDKNIFNSLFEAEHHRNWHEKDNQFFNSGFESDYHPKWHENGTHFFVSGFEGEHRPNWHEKDSHLFKSSFRGEHRLNWNENYNHLFNSGFEGENHPNWPEKDKHLFNSLFGGEHPPNWHEYDNHLFNSPFGGEKCLNWHETENHFFNKGFRGDHRPNWHDKDNHLLNSPFGGEHRPNWHENDNHLLKVALKGFIVQTDTKMTTIYSTVASERRIVQTDTKIGRFCKPNFGSVFRKVRQSEFGRAGLEYSWRSRTEFFVLQTEFSFSVRFDQSQEVCSVGDSLHRDVQAHYREVESLLATRPLLMELAGPSRSPTERLAN